MVLFSVALLCPVIVPAQSSSVPALPPGSPSSFEKAIAELVPHLRDLQRITKGGVSISGVIDSDWRLNPASALIPAQSRVYVADKALLVGGPAILEAGGDPWIISSQWNILKPVHAPPLSAASGQLAVLRFIDGPRDPLTLVPSDLDFANAQLALTARTDRPIGGRHLVDRIKKSIEGRYGTGSFDRFNAGQLAEALNEIAVSSLYTEKLESFELPKLLADQILAARKTPPANRTALVALNRPIIALACPELFASPRFETLRGTISGLKGILEAPARLEARDLEWLAIMDADSWFRANPPAKANLAARRDHTALIDQLGMEVPGEPFVLWMRHNESRRYGAPIKDDPFGKTMEERYPILRYIRFVEERALAEIKATRVESGIRVWKLYNMGTIVKTKDACFSFDLWPMTTDFSGVLDFAVVSHVHDDHYSQVLLDALIAKGKTVYSPFYKKGVIITKDRIVQQGSLEIEFRVSSQVQFGVPSLITTVDCGPSESRFRILHSGDSNRASDFPRLGPIHLAFSQWDYWNENPDDGLYHSIAYGTKVFDHRLELAHSIGQWRGPFEEAYARIEELGIEADAQIIMWGETFAFESPPKISPTPFVIDYRFNTGRDGWEPVNGITDFASREGRIEGRALNDDPSLVLEPISVMGSETQVIRVVLSANAGSSLALYWISEDDETWDEEKAIHLPLVADGSIHTYRFELAGKQNWSGHRIVGLRLDPLESGIGTFTVEEIVGEK